MSGYHCKDEGDHNLRIFQTNPTFQYQKEKLKLKKREIEYSVKFLNVYKKIKEVEKQTNK